MPTGGQPIARRVQVEFSSMAGLRRRTKELAWQPAGWQVHAGLLARLLVEGHTRPVSGQGAWLFFEDGCCDRCGDAVFAPPR